MNATQTAVNISTLTPVVRLYRQPDGGVDWRTTAQVFVKQNFRHLINRRMKWSTCEQFVRTALEQLANLICTKASLRDIVRQEIDLCTTTVRYATNRRLSFSKVANNLCIDVECLLEVARRVQ